jgi:hypothetical protein
MTARFKRDQANSIARLLRGTSHHHRYLIKAKLKPHLRAALRELHGIWQGSLFPDSPGAARIAGELFPPID